MFYRDIIIYHSSHNILYSLWQSHTITIIPQKPSLANADMFSLLQFSDDFEYLSQWLKLISIASAEKSAPDESVNE